MIDCQLCDRYSQAERTFGVIITSDVRRAELLRCAIQAKLPMAVVQLEFLSMMPALLDPSGQQRRYRLYVEHDTRDVELVETAHAFFVLGRDAIGYHIIS